VKPHKNDIISRLEIVFATRPRDRAMLAVGLQVGCQRSPFTHRPHVQGARMKHTIFIRQASQTMAEARLPL